MGKETPWDQILCFNIMRDIKVKVSCKSSICFTEGVTVWRSYTIASYGVYDKHGKEKTTMSIYYGILVK